MLLVGCGWQLAPEGSYFEERIQPTLREGCALTTSGCHVADERGSAMGNLDLTSYDSLRRRPPMRSSPTGRIRARCSCAPGFDADAVPMPDASFARFVSEVQPIVVESCGAASCHGAALADYHVSCGETEAEQRWNHWISVQMLGLEPEQSELLSRPLAASRGGAFHGGGDTFADSSDENYRRMLSWAEDLVSRAPETVQEADVTPGYRYFVNRVQPVFFGGAAHPEDCVGIDVDGGDLNEIPAYCVLARWHEIEHAALALDPLHHLVWVERPLGIGTATDFDTYRPGADLRIATATTDATGALSSSPTPTSTSTTRAPMPTPSASLPSCSTRSCRRASCRTAV